MYDEDGKLDFESMYFMNKENRLEIYYTLGAVADFTIYDNGTELKLDTSIKTAMLRVMSNSH